MEWQVGDVCEVAGVGCGPFGKLARIRMIYGDQSMTMQTLDRPGVSFPAEKSELSAQVFGVGDKVSLARPPNSILEHRYQDDGGLTCKSPWALPWVFPKSFVNGTIKHIYKPQHVEVMLETGESFCFWTGWLVPAIYGPVSDWSNGQYAAIEPPDVVIHEPPLKIYEPLGPYPGWDQCVQVLKDELARARTENESDKQLARFELNKVSVEAAKAAHEAADKLGLAEAEIQMLRKRAGSHWRDPARFNSFDASDAFGTWDRGLIIFVSLILTPLRAVLATVAWPIITTATITKKTGNWVYSKWIATKNAGKAWLTDQVKRSGFLWIEGFDYFGLIVLIAFGVLAGFIFIGAPYIVYDQNVRGRYVNQADNIVMPPPLTPERIAMERAYLEAKRPTKRKMVRVR